MEKAMYPSPYIRITQKDHIGTHADSWAIDEAGSDGGIDYLIAPFTGTIKKIYTADANEVWLESKDKVQFSDGTQDYMTIMLAHDNDVSNLKTGQAIKQGQRFYEEGTKGNASGNHVHLEVAKGKFTGTGWHQNSAGYWSINNGKKIDECLWIDDSYKLMNTAGYNFKNVKDAEPKKYGKPVSRDENKNQIEIKADNVRARNKANGDVLGYINKGIYNSLEIVSEANYEWHKVDDGLWVANGDWATWLPKKEVIVATSKEELIAELANENTALIEENRSKTEKINTLNEQVNNLNSTINQLQAELAKIVMPKLIFECTKSGYYAIKLTENQKLYLE